MKEYTKSINSKGEWVVKVKDNNKTIEKWYFSQKAYGKLAEKMAQQSIELEKRIYNYIEIKKEYAIMYWTSKNNSEIFKIFIDIEDINKIRKHRWFVKKDKRNCYCLSTCSNILLHRFVLNIIDSSIIIDHKDRNGLNNTKKNLRIATINENARNRKKSKNNNSGKGGVHYNSSKQYYVARIIDNNGNRIERSYSANKYGQQKALELAIQARKKLEQKYGYICE